MNWQDVEREAFKRDHADQIVISNLVDFYNKSLRWTGELRPRHIIVSTTAPDKYTLNDTLIIPLSSLGHSHLSMANTAKEILAARVAFLSTVPIPRTIKDSNGRVFDVVAFCPICHSQTCPNADLVTVGQLLPAPPPKDFL